jgi:outer membrane protein insertion porin family
MRWLERSKRCSPVCAAALALWIGAAAFGPAARALSSDAGVFDCSSSALGLDGGSEADAGAVPADAGIVSAPFFGPGSSAFQGSVAADAGIQIAPSFGPSQAPAAPEKAEVADAGIEVAAPPLPPADAGVEAPEYFDPDGLPIVSIEVVGNSRVPRDQIVGVLTQKVGEPFSSTRASNDLRAIYALGQFADVQLSADPAPGGVLYRIAVVEQPLLGKVEITGEHGIQKKDLLDQLGLKTGSVASDSALHAAAQRLEKLYSERGWALTTVTPVATQSAPGTLDVVFQIVEGPKVRVSKVALEGVAPERQKALRKALPLKPKNIITRFSGTSLYTRERLDRAVEAAESYYFDRGYIEAKVEPVVVFSDDRRTVAITFHVSEGLQYRISGIRFEGETIVPVNELRAMLTVRPGEPIDRSKVAADVSAITLRLENLGYACALVVPNLAKQEAAHEAELVFAVEPGNKARVGEIQVSGNKHTRERVILRELTFKPGDPYSAEAVRRSIERLRALGIFKGAGIEKLDGCEDGTVGLEVAVQEAKTLGYQLSFGFSTDDKIVGTLMLADRNIFGTGRSVLFQGQLSAIRSVVEAAYYEPYLLHTSSDLSLDFGWNRLEYVDFTRSDLGGGLALRYLLGRGSAKLEGFVASFSFSVHQVDITDTAVVLDPAIAPLFSGGRISAVGVGASYERPEPLAVVPRGRAASFTAEVAPGFLGSNIRFTRYTAKARWSFPLPAGLLARAHGSAGWINQIGSRTLPVSERYFVGGFETLRGYRYRTISPSLFVVDQAVEPPTEEKVLIGGTTELLLGLELEGPLWREYLLNGVVFSDAGDVYVNGEAPQQGLPLGLYYSVGFGVRWYSPAGVVRVELAFPLVHRPGDPPVLLELGAGALP